MLLICVKGRYQHMLKISLAFLIVTGSFIDYNDGTLGCAEILTQ